MRLHSISKKPKLEWLDSFGFCSWPLDLRSMKRVSDSLRISWEGGGGTQTLFLFLWQFPRLHLFSFCEHTYSLSQSKNLKWPLPHNLKYICQQLLQKPKGGNFISKEFRAFSPLFALVLAKSKLTKTQHKTKRCQKKYTAKEKRLCPTLFSFPWTQSTFWLNLYSLFKLISLKTKI